MTISASNPPHIYLLPGMARDYPVFTRLAPLLQNATVVQFIEPNPDESLTSYALRMSEKIRPDGCIVGVSFGGIVAAEISRMIRPRGCVLISSVIGPHQFPFWIRAFRMVGAGFGKAVLSMVSRVVQMVPRRFRSRSSIRLGEFNGRQGAWYRWAISVISGWQPAVGGVDVPVLQVHGDADTTFPIRHIDADVVILGGRHALPMTHPQNTLSAEC